MPMKLCLELVYPVRTDLLDTNREFYNDVIDEVDGIFLDMPVIDLQRPYARGIVNGGVLIAFDLCAIIPFERQKLNVYLDIRNGSIWNSGRYRCAIDTLLSGANTTISDARDESYSRIEVDKLD